VTTRKYSGKGTDITKEERFPAKLLKTRTRKSKLGPQGLGLPVSSRDPIRRARGGLTLSEITTTPTAPARRGSCGEDLGKLKADC